MTPSIIPTTAPAPITAPVPASAPPGMFWGASDVVAAAARFERDLSLESHQCCLLECEISGVPVTQGSTRVRVARRSGRPYVTHDRAHELAAWRASVAVEIRRALGSPVDPWDGPALLQAVFYLPRPGSVSRRRWLPMVKPDLDKLTRALGDGIVDSGLLTEDSRITDLQVAKRYVDACPGVEAPGVALRLYGLMSASEAR